MKIVRIINGTYGHRPAGAKFVSTIQTGETVPVSDEEAARLVSMRVAAYVSDTPLVWPPVPVATPAGSKDNGDTGETTPDSLPPSTGPERDEDEDNVELREGTGEVADVLDIVDGHFTTESLMQLTRSDMEKLANDLGVDISKCKSKNKGDIAVLLSAVDIQADDGADGPPELGTEEPV